MTIENNIPGWMDAEEMGVLSFWAQSVQPNGRIVEVGSLLGRSAEIWRRYSDPTVEIYCIDMFIDGVLNHEVKQESFSFPIPIEKKVYNLLEEFQNNVKDFKNFKFIQAELPRQIELYDNMPIDILFIDAAHTNPNDWDIIKGLAKFVKKGGMITGHDYCEYWPEVVENAKRLSTIYENEIKLYGETSIWGVSVTKDYDEISFI